MKTSLKQALLILGVLASIGTVLVGSVGLLAADRMSRQLDTATAMGDAMQNAALADMMHDAIRSSVLQGLLSAQAGDVAGLKQAAQELEEHAADFNKYLTTLQAIDLPPDIRQQVATVVPKAQAYARSGADLVRLMGTDLERAKAGMAAFGESFELLETALAEPGKSLEAYGETVRGQGVEVTRQTRIWIVLALALVALGVMALCWRIIGRVIAGLAAAGAVAEAVAQGDLSQAVAADSPYSEVRLLQEHLGQMSTGLHRLVGEVRQSAEAVATAGGQIAMGNMDLSSRTETQASGLQETAAGIQELTESVRESAEQVLRASERSRHAREVAEQGGAAMGESVATMRRIETSSRKIADITGMIDSIAFQTNILALNAAVEAARAGEQGRGFAVVASEVRSLASRSAEAAREIKALIQTSVQEVSQGVSQVDKVGGTVGTVATAIGEVAGLMEQIAGAMGEQSRGIAQISEAIALIDQATQQNAALVEEGAAASQSLRDQAQALVDGVAVFRLG
jgi:methyl-accepting chemotaxis protein